VVDIYEVNVLIIRKNISCMIMSCIFHRCVCKIIFNYEKKLFEKEKLLTQHFVEVPIPNMFVYSTAPQL